MEEHIFSFKANSHILSLLGDELIGSDNLAIFELVKNAYDADATNVRIIFENVNTHEATITIEDNGCGMSLKIIENSWLEIGTDFKRGTNKKISKKYKRNSLGEKGVGRLAVHKLATNIRLETKEEGELFGHTFNINWKELIKNANYIEDTRVLVSDCPNTIFIDKPHGTRIILSNLRRKMWQRKDFRNLARSINTLISPFENKTDNFQVDLILPKEQEDWIKDIYDIQSILKSSIYHFKFFIDEEAGYTWTYQYTPPSGFKLEPNSITQNHDKLLLDNKNLILKKEQLKEIGTIAGEFHVFNLSPDVLNTFNQNETIKKYLKENAGVRVYRDAIRVYNYGEPGNDWLGLDIVRTNSPGSKFSNNTILGAISLDLKLSLGLKEKTNREGFDQNGTYERFENICFNIVNDFASKARKDRELLDYAIKNEKPIKKVGFSETIGELKEQIKKKNLESELGKTVLKVEKDYLEMRDVMINSGMAGLNLSLVFHEVEREIRYINEDIKRGSNLNEISAKVANVMQLLDGFAPILRQQKRSAENISAIIQRVFKLVNSRIKYHELIFSSPLLSGESNDFQIVGQSNLLVSALNNIIDNSIYWTRVKREKEGVAYKPCIFVTTNVNEFNGPTLIIGDNGDGFKLTPEDMTRPFVTTKPGGMGLGLYYASLVMEMYGGKLLFIDPRDYELPSAVSGAVVALEFKNN
jgi:signal transduction histidine kinase